MKNTLIIALILSSSWLAAQVDQARMTKDIDIAENVLETLVTQNMDINANSWDDLVKGNYIEGYGVVFTIKTSMKQFALSFNDSETITLFRSGDKTYTFDTDGLRLRKKDEEETVEETQADLVDSVKPIAEEYFTRYAFLIKQLKPTDKVLLNFIDDLQERVFTFNPFDDDISSSNRMELLSAEIKKSDIEAFRTKKIDEEAFLERIQYEDETTETTEISDVETLISIFKTLYEQTDDDKPQFVMYDFQYNYIKGLGVIIDIEAEYTDDKVESFFDRQISKIENDNEAAKEKVEVKFQELFDPFIKTFKENVVEYGQTVQSIASNELLVFNIDFDDIREDDAEVSIKRSILDSYNSGKINFDEAVSKVKVQLKPE